MLGSSVTVYIIADIGKLDLFLFSYLPVLLYENMLCITEFISAFCAVVPLTVTRLARTARSASLLESKPTEVKNLSSRIVRLLFQNPIYCTTFCRVCKHLFTIQFVKKYTWVQSKKAPFPPFRSRELLYVFLFLRRALFLPSFDVSVIILDQARKQRRYERNNSHNRPYRNIRQNELKHFSGGCLRVIFFCKHT